MQPHPAPPRTFLREPRHVVAALRLLVFLGLAVLGWTRPPESPYIYWSITVVYGLTVAGYLAAHNGDFRMRRVRIAIFLFDAAVVAALIVLRGRDVQPLIMSYFMLVLLAALLAGVGNALVNGLLVTALYTVVSCWGRPPSEIFDLALLGPVFFFFVIAVFMGHVTGESRRHRDVRRSEPPAHLRESTARLRAARDGLWAEARLRTVEMLCAGIAHELRQPSAALRECMDEGAALVEALVEAQTRGEDTAGLLGELRALMADGSHEAQRLGSVAAALNQLGRGGSAQRVPTPITDLVQPLAQFKAGEAGPEIRVVAESDSVRAVHGDPARLRHVVDILVGNALDAVRPQGRGTVSVRALDGATDTVVLEVRDDGAGIAPEVVERMYDPFYTTKGPGQGTGLGLYVAREIVRAHGGDIECSSTPGEGTVVRVELPAHVAEENAEAA